MPVRPPSVGVRVTSVPTPYPDSFAKEQSTASRKVTPRSPTTHNAHSALLRCSIRCRYPAWNMAMLARVRYSRSMRTWACALGVLTGQGGCSPVSWEGSSALVWDAERLRVATDAAGVALWSWNIDTDEIALDERAHGL